MRARTRRTVTLLAALALVVAACGGDGSSPSPAPSTGAPATSEATLPAPTGSPAPSEALLPSAESPGEDPSAGIFDPEAVELGFEVVTGGLDSPLAVTGAGDDSGRLFVVEQVGRVRIVRDGTLVDRPFLDISDRVLAGGEQGLLGLAFHPDYPRDPRLFLNYTDRSGTTIVASYRLTDDSEAADPASETELLRIAQPYANHNGGAVAFGHDGYLYVATGDGGAAGDPHDNGQRIDTHLGKVLRIDVDRTEGELAYAIPPDNPLLDEPDAKPEIWLTGLRNPWRMSFDRASGDLWIGDVGQGSWEEVNVAPAGRGGLNFGWNRMEGVECFQDAGCENPAFTLPVAEYSHDFGCSITGGIVYRGSGLPALTGGYLFADYCSGNVWVLDPSVDGRSPARLVFDSGRSISSIGEDDAGEPYATDLAGGDLLRITTGD